MKQINFATTPQQDSNPPVEDESGHGNPPPP